MAFSTFWKWVESLKGELGDRDIYDSEERNRENATGDPSHSLSDVQDKNFYDPIKNTEEERRMVLDSVDHDTVLEYYWSYFCASTCTDKKDEGGEEKKITRDDVLRNTIRLVKKNGSGFLDDYVVPEWHPLAKLGYTQQDRWKGYDWIIEIADCKYVDADHREMIWWIRGEVVRILCDVIVNIINSKTSPSRLKEKEYEDGESLTFADLSGPLMDLVQREGYEQQSQLIRDIETELTQENDLVTITTTFTGEKEEKI